MFMSMLEKPQKKFFSVVRHLGPYPSSLVVTFLLELQKKFFFLVARPLPPPFSCRATKKTFSRLPLVNSECSCRWWCVWPYNSVGLGCGRFVWHPRKSMVGLTDWRTGSVPGLPGASKLLHKNAEAY